MFKKMFSSIHLPPIREKGQGSAEFGTILAGLLVAVLIVIAVFRNALIALFQRVAGLMSGG